MIPLPGFDKLFSQVAGMVGQSSDLGPELQAQFKLKLQTMLSKMDLVTREEFDAQAAVLLRTREQLEKLERELEALNADKDH